MSKRLTIHGAGEHGKTRCGLRGLPANRMTAFPRRVTCNRCRKIMGLGATWAQKRANELPPAVSTKRAVDAIIGAVSKASGIPRDFLTGERAFEHHVALERVCELAAELCNAFDAADEDIGGHRPVPTILQDLASAVEDVRKLKG